MVVGPRNGLRDDLVVRLESVRAELESAADDAARRRIEKEIAAVEREISKAAKALRRSVVF
jgi:hypothetical protein